MRRNINSEVSGDIMELIFSKLPFFNLPNCRLVCKAWNNHLLNLSSKTTSSINSNNLFFAHISPYSNLHCVDLDPQHFAGFSIVASFNFHPSWSSSTVKFLNSCNGLLFCSLTNPTSFMSFQAICILNPMTNEYLKLSSSNKQNRNNRNYVIYSYGFGFSLKTKHYKIVRCYFVPDKSATLVEIFTFGANNTSHQWTHVGFVSFGLEGHGAYFNGALYWVGTHHQRRPSTNVIFRFDVEDEIFEEISFPQYEKPRGDPLFCFFGILNGSLYLTFGLSGLVEYQVWKMEEDSSWIQAFVLPIRDVVYLDHPHQLRRSCHRSHYLQLIKACEDGTILCLHSGFGLILYDLKTGRTQISTPQDFLIRRHLLVHQIDCFNFDPLHKILGGDVEC